MKYRDHLQAERKTLSFAEQESRKREIAEHKRIIVSCQRKLEREFNPNWNPPLLGNWRTLLEGEIVRLEAEIKELSEGL